MEICDSPKETLCERAIAMSSDTSDMTEPQETESSTLETQNPEATNDEAIDPAEPAFGWTRYSEQVNGRFAMLGFILLVILETVTHQDLFTWLGLR